MVLGADAVPRRIPLPAMSSTVKVVVVSSQDMRI